LGLFLNFLQLLLQLLGDRQGISTYLNKSVIAADRISTLPRRNTCFAVCTGSNGIRINRFNSSIVPGNTDGVSSLRQIAIPH